MRIFLQYILPLIAPFAVYLAWYAFSNRGGGKKVPHWEEGPWFWLFVTGSVLVLIGMGIVALIGGGEPGAVYHPPVMKDGKVVPGRFE